MSRWRFIACVQICDFLTFCVVCNLWLNAIAKAGGTQRTSLGQFPLLWLIVTLLGAGLIHCTFQHFKLYELEVLTHPIKSSVLTSCIGMISSVPFLAPLLINIDGHGPTALAAIGVVAAEVSVLAVARMLTAWISLILQKAGVIKRRLYVITETADCARSLTSQLERMPENNVVGLWILAGLEGPIEDALQGALDYLAVNPVDAVVLNLPLDRPDRLIEAVRVVRRLPREVLLAPQFPGAEKIFLRTWRADDYRSDWPDGMTLIKVSERPLAGWRWVLKDVQDRLIAVVLLALLAPVMLTIMIGIKFVDPGPVFFRQKRRGYGGDLFNMVKFRTMRVLSAAPDAKDRRLQLTTRDDPRVFPFGRLLRKTSLDELPQLFNVIAGDMWIVGPRPHSPYALAGGTLYAEAVQDYVARYRIKPGITGWAQVCGWRGPTENLEQLSGRVEHDLYYIENWSMLFDVKILFRTLSCAFGHENAF